MGIRHKHAYLAILFPKLCPWGYVLPGSGVKSLKECFTHPCPAAVTQVRQRKVVASKLFKRIVEKGEVMSYRSPSGQIPKCMEGGGWGWARAGVHLGDSRVCAKEKPKELSTHIAGDCNERPHLEQGRI